MFTINSFPFAQLKNAEHVSFFNNVAIELEKKTATVLGMADSQLKAFRTSIEAEQDIVNRSLASVYTEDMKAMDADRDRLFRLVRGKIALCPYASPSSALAMLSESVQKNLLTKYGNEVISQAYQEETAVIRGFIHDITMLYDDEEIATLGIQQDLMDLEHANDAFSELYNRRATEKSLATPELTKQLREATEELYHLACIHLEFKANNEAGTEPGMACGESLAVVNQLIKDARTRLNQRLGRVPETESGGVISGEATD